MSGRSVPRAVVVVLAALLTAAPCAVAQDTGAGDRGMAFRPGLGEAAHERVPGGRLLVLAYSALMVILGGYVGFIARKAARLEDEVRRLEDDLEGQRKGR